MPSGIRLQRIADRIRQEISEMLIREISDPRLQQIFITDVKLDKELAFADGDAVGALLGVGLALQKAGKSVQMVLMDGVTSSFRHLEGSEKVLREPQGGHDTFITVDCADFKRTGKVFENF